MDTSFFAELIKRAESDLVDFKRDMYDFSKEDSKEYEHKRAQFVKDVICMNNTPRDESAYIVLGVKKYVDNTFDCVGLQEQIDGVLLQDQLRDLVHPHPRFHYEPVVFDGVNYGVIEFPVERRAGPCYVTKSVGATLRPNQLYHRRDSQNSEADPHWQGKIWEYFRPSGDNAHIKEDGTPSWDEFVDAVDSFDDNHRYILVTSRIQPDHGLLLENLGLVKWSLVADFDPESSESGLLRASRETLESHRSLHMVVKGDQPTLNLSTATYWYFAQGITGRQLTLSPGKIKDWSRDYGKDITQQLERLAVAMEAQPVTIIILSDAIELIEHFKRFIQAANEAFVETAKCVILTQQKEAFRTFEDVIDTKIINIPTDQLCHGLEVLKKNKHTSETNLVLVPSSSGASIPIEDSKLLWLNEELEIVHLNIGSRPVSISDSNLGRDFLRGREDVISWYELGLHVDVDRDVTTQLTRWNC